MAIFMLILIADDEAGTRNVLRDLLQGSHELIVCSDGEEALRALEKTSVDLVITDNVMPKLTGLELIRKGKEVAPGTAFVMMSAFGGVDQAVEAIRIGAEDYFLKPFELSEIEHRVQRIEDLRSWKAENALRQGDPERGGANRLLGKSPAIQRAKEFVQKVSPVASPVLLLGPSGSGKEVLARAIHDSSPRAPRPFVAINCASLSEQLMESELFGHEKGAFTGATAAKPGKFELAKGGTLFLDEIGELPPPLQAKLLRVLQEKEFCRVGGVRVTRSDARVVAATHRNLKEMAAQGTFREDLYFRLNVLAFTMPPLNARAEDIPLLAEFFVDRFRKEFAKSVRLAPETLDALSKYSFPGNVRELQNVLERLVVLAANGEQIRPDSLPSEFTAGGAEPSRSSGSAPALGARGLSETLDEIEGRLVQEAMERSGHNQVKAAALLKITRGALQYKLKKYGLLPSDRAA